MREYGPEDVERLRRSLAMLSPRAPAFVMDMLAEHLARRGLTAADARVFVSPRGGPLRGSNFRMRVLKPALETAKPRGVNGHGLRHVAASLMIDAGVHPRVIQHRLGHATARSSMELFNHVSEPTERAAADHLDTMFGEGLGHTGFTPGVSASS